MKVNLKYVVIPTTFIIAALSYYTDSPTIGAALCAGLICGYFGTLLGALVVVHKLSSRLPKEAVKALLTNDCEVRVVEMATTTKNPTEIDQAVKEFHEMLNERERKAKNGE